MKKLSVWMLTLALVFGLTAPALAEEKIPDLPQARTDLLISGNPTDKNEALKALGGTPGKINVRLNDKCVAFPDAFPELVDGNTMVPVRAVTESLGAKVDMGEEQVVTIVLDNATIKLTIGQTKVTVTRGDQTEEITLNAAPYIKDSRTYVPLRFVSETFGYDVFWDQNMQTVVILDKEVIIADFNDKLSTVNLMMEKQAKYLEGNWKSEGTMDLSVEIMDSAKGNKTYNIPGTLTMHNGDGVMDMTMTMDLVALLPLVDQLIQETDTSDLDLIAMLKSLAGKQTMSLKLLKTGEMYFNMPIMDAAMAQVVNTELKDGESFWYQYPDMMAQMFNASNYDMGNLMYTSMVAQGELFQGAFYLYDYLAMTKTQMVAIMGNDTFTQSGETYTWSLDKAKLLTMLGITDAATIAEINKVLPVLTMKMTFDSKGDTTVSCAIKVDMADAGLVLDLGVNGQTKDDKETMDMTMSIKDLFNMTMKMNTSSTKTTEVPVVSLPAGAKVIQLEELMAMTMGDMVTQP